MGGSHVRDSAARGHREPEGQGTVHTDDVRFTQSLREFERSQREFALTRRAAIKDRRTARGNQARGSRSWLPFPPRGKRQGDEAPHRGANSNNSNGSVIRVSAARQWAGE